jgi:hypothetical protein
MEKEPPTEELDLKNIKLMVCTPSIDSKCSIHYFASCMSLRGQCEKLGYPVEFEFESSNSIIIKARNNLVKRFMESELNFTHLLMVDSDVSFQARDIIKLIVLNKDVIGGAVSKKDIKWQTIKNFIQKNPDIETENMPYFGCSGNYVPFEDKDGNKYVIGSGPSAFQELTLNVPVRAATVGTALMLIKRSVFEKMEKTYPKLKYTEVAHKQQLHQSPDNEETLDERNEQATHDQCFSYFETERTKENFLMGEDVSFCQRVNDMGMEVWVWPWMTTAHYGDHEFPLDMRKWIS